MEEEAKIIITRGKADDNAEYVDLINYAFGFNGMESSFYKLLPKLFGKERNPAADTYFVKDEKGRLLACAGLFPLKMRVCGKCYKAYGIGNVAVHPAMRGKGYMKAVMKAATDFAINDGAIMLILSGKRTRYDHFGFEKCGTDACYTLTSKTLFDRDPNFSPSLTIRRSHQTTPSLLTTYTVFIARKKDILALRGNVRTFMIYLFHGRARPMCFTAMKALRAGLWLRAMR